MELAATGTEVLIWTVPAELPGQLPPPEPFRPAAALRSVACGGGVAAFVTEDRRLYLLDLRSPPSEPHGSPRLAEALRETEVDAAACGSSHVIALTSTGVAYWLALTNASEAITHGRGVALAMTGCVMHVELPPPLRARRVSCGAGHVLLATDEGVLFAFGDGHHGQLGLGEVRSAPAPVAVPGLAQLEVHDVAAGAFHSCAATGFGNVFTWGDNSEGQLADGTTAPKAAPCLLASPEGVCAVAAARATAALCGDGRAFAWGFGGQLRPVLAFAQRVGALAMGEGALLAVGRGGELLRKQLGAAGHCLATTPAAVLVPSGVLAVAASGRHVVALTAARRLPALPAPVPAQEAPLEAQLREPRPQQAWPERRRPAAGGGADRAAGEEVPALLRRERQPPEAGAAGGRVPLALEEAPLEKEEGPPARPRRTAALGAQELEEVAELIAMQDELSSVRLALRRSLEAQDISARVTSTVDHEVASDLRNRCEELEQERELLFAERRDLETELLATKAEVVDNGQLLRRIDEACARTREAEEQQCEQLRTLRLGAEEREAELLLAATAPTDEAMAELRAELAEEQRTLQELQLELQAARPALRKRLLGELQGEVQEHAEAEQRLAGGRLWAERWREEVEALQGEHACVCEELREESERADEAEKKALEAMRERSARAVASLPVLRARLGAAEEEEAALQSAIHNRALRFAEDSQAMYSKLERLHAATPHLKNQEGASATAGKHTPGLGLGLGYPCPLHGPRPYHSHDSAPPSHPNLTRSPIPRLIQDSYPVMASPLEFSSGPGQRSRLGLEVGPGHGYWPALGPGLEHAAEQVMGLHAKSIFLTQASASAADSAAETLAAGGCWGAGAQLAASGSSTLGASKGRTATSSQRPPVAGTAPPPAASPAPLAANPLPPASLPAANPVPPASRLAGRATPRALGDGLPAASVAPWVPAASALSRAPDDVPLAPGTPPSASPWATSGMPSAVGAAPWAHCAVPSAAGAEAAAVPPSAANAAPPAVPLASHAALSASGAALPAPPVPPLPGGFAVAGRPHRAVAPSPAAPGAAPRLGWG